MDDNKQFIITKIVSIKTKPSYRYSDIRFTEFIRHFSRKECKTHQQASQKNASLTNHMHTYTLQAHVKPHHRGGEAAWVLAAQACLKHHPNTRCKILDDDDDVDPITHLICQLQMRKKGRKRTNG